MTYNFKFPHNTGLHCIAAGMHWGPTDKASLIAKGAFKEENLDKDFKQSINHLTERKESCDILVKSKPSLYAVLKNVHQ